MDNMQNYARISAMLTNAIDSNKEANKMLSVF